MVRKTLLGIALIALLAPMVSAQTLDEVLAKHYEAMGGLAKIKAVTSHKTTAKMVLPQGIELPVLMYQKRPNAFRMEFTMQGMTGTQAYDGKTAWMVMPMMGKKDPEAMPAEETDQMKEQAEFDGPLVDYKDKGNTVELVGKEQVEGADAHKLKVTLKNGNIRNIYLDAETYLQIKSESKRTVRGTDVESESYLSDYKEVDGMMMPFAVEAGVKGNPQRQKIVIEKIEFNPVLSDTLFTMPVVAAADTTKAAGAVKAAAGAAKDGAKATTAKADTAKAGAKKK